jgi:hypothetical protein
MSEVSDIEAEKLASAFRPNRRPLLITLGLNLTLAALLLGVPYWRGRNLAEAQRRDFGAFTRCLIGGELASAPGLSLPRGERDHFASKFLFANAAWPLSCRPALHKLEAPDAIFLWPSVKQAGADVNAAVALVERELMRLDERRKKGPGRVPERPLEALKRLQAAAALYVRAAGADAGIDNDAIRFDARAGGLAAPARLPLGAGESSTLALWSSDMALEALALDGRGLSYLRVADGKIDRERVKRSTYVRGTVRAGATPYVVWATPDARCKEREDRCAGRPSGLALYDRGGTELAEPTWKLPGHPAGRVDRALQVSELGRIELVARSSADGALEWLRFRLPTETGTPDPKAQSLEASERLLLRGPGSAADSVQLLAADGGPAVLFASEPSGPSSSGPQAPAAASAAKPSSAQPSGGSPAPSAQPSAATTALSARPSDAPTAVQPAADQAAPAQASVTAGLAFPNAQPPLQLPAASGHGPWAIGCSQGDGYFIAYGSHSQLRIAHVDAARTVRELATADVALRPPLDPEDGARDQVRFACDAGRAQLLFNAEDGTLEQIGCAADSCGERAAIAHDVATYSALAQGEDLFVAYAGVREAALVRVLRLDRTGHASAKPLTPAACWEPLGGMCGTPTLLRDAQRLILTARDGTDLLALESTDRAQSFGTLSGFVVGNSFEPSTTSPLKQHRVRKGLD